jgi:hypothetical protein
MHPRFIALVVTAAIAVAEFGPFQRASYARQDADELTVSRSRPRGVDERANPTTFMSTLPLSFEQNVGQSDARVSFLARGRGYGVFLTPSELVLTTRHGAEPDRPVQSAALRMRLEGARMSDPVGEVPLEAKTNYFIGNDPAKWQTDVPNFARVRYTNVYPGVDLVYYGAEGTSVTGELEFDFVVRPGADPSGIVMAWDGAESIDVDEDGALLLRVPGGVMRQGAPVVYQEAEPGSSAKAAVAGAYAVDGGGRVGLRLGDYDTSKPLVIDPPFGYVSSLSGSTTDIVYDIAVGGPDDHAYVTGATWSSNFPDDGYGAYESRADVFVARLDENGGRLYSAFLGGTPDALGGGDDIGYGIAVNAAGAAFVTGSTNSHDFPDQFAYQDTWQGGPSGADRRDAFVAKLNGNGNLLLFSSFLGGSLGSDTGFDIALGGQGAVWLTGFTTSSNFPQEGGLFPYGGKGDGFVAMVKMGHSLLDLEYSTFLGGSELDSGEGIALDGSKNIYLTGYTESSNFPKLNAHDSTYNGAGDAFVTKLTSGGAAVAHSSFLGGLGFDDGNDIAVDSAGAAYVTGYTESSILFLVRPIPTGFDHGYNGEGDGFAAKISALGTRLLYFTYLGGSGRDEGQAIAVNSTGAAYVAGSMFQGGSTDIFVKKLSANANTELSSNFFGAAGVDIGYGIALDSAGEVYVAGLGQVTPTSDLDGVVIKVN